MSRQGGTAPDRARRGQATKAALLAAARELFVTKGYYATGTEEIVRAPRSGREVRCTTISPTSRRRKGPAHPRRDHHLGRRPWGRLVAGLQGFLTAALEPEVQRIILIDGPTVLDWNAWRELEGHYAITIIEAALQAAMDQGTIRAQPRRELAHLILAVVGEAALLVAHSGNHKAARRNASQTLGQLLDGLRR
jgi:hypothetical protein